MQLVKLVLGLVLNSGDNNFSTTTNWSCTGGGTLPTAGDNIIMNTANVNSANPLLNNLNLSLGNFTLSGTSAIYINNLRVADNSVIEIVGTAKLITGTSSASLTKLIADGNVEIKNAGNFGVDGGGITAVGIVTLTNSLVNLSETDTLGGLTISGTSVAYYKPTAASNGTFELTYPVVIEATATGVNGVTFSFKAKGTTGMETPTTYNSTGQWTLNGNRQVYVGPSTTVNVNKTPIGGQLTKDADSVGSINVLGVEVTASNSLGAPNTGFKLLAANPIMIGLSTLIAAVSLFLATRRVQT